MNYDFTYQIPLICEVRVGWVFVLFGSGSNGDRLVDRLRRDRFVAALEPTKANLLHGRVDLNAY